MSRMQEIDVVARTVWGEARNQGSEGMRAVAAVIVNRVNTDLHGDGKPDWWGEGFVAVCQKPWQFSCWNANDPNRAKLLAVTPADPAFARALAIATEAVDGALIDPTGGAVQYHTIRPAAAVWPPRWARDMVETVRIRDHVFYRLP